MINGAHVLIYSSDAEADRAFLRDVLGFPYVDVGHGWLIFALPPAEVAIHPVEDVPPISHSGNSLVGTALYLMCDDLTSTVRSLKEQNVRCTSVAGEPWGIATSIVMPSGGEIGLYQPTHQTALGMKPTERGP